MGKRTVAIIGGTGKFCPGLAKAAVQQDLRLLFISRQNSTFEQELKKLSIAAEVEFLTCEKEGCWEADAIAFTRPDEIEPALLTRIEKVATQKPVLVIGSLEENKELCKKVCFQDLLPHSQVVELKLAAAEFGIFGRKTKVNEMVRDFFKAAGYQENNELWK